MHESLQALDEIRLNFNSGGILILNITIAFIMFGVALQIKVDQFKKILFNPKNVLIGFFSQFFLLPAVTFILILIFSKYITPTIALGMMLVAACPGGNVSNFISSLAKGNVALSVSLTAIATIAAIFMTPLNFKIWGGLYLRYISIHEANSLLQPLVIPLGQVFQTIFILLGIPIIIGMFVNWKFPKLTAVITKPIKIFSIVAFGSMVILAFISNYEYFWEHIKYIAIIVFFHNAFAFLTGYSFASVFKLSKTDVKTISIETGIQNSALGLALLFNPKIFPPELAIGGMAFIAAWWGIWHILAGLGLAGFWALISEKKIASRS